jgi:hypothetical protein
VIAVGSCIVPLSCQDDRAGIRRQTVREASRGRAARYQQRRDLAPGMLHRHGAHAEAAARITWCITEHAPGVITGEVGAGETVALRAWADAMRRSIGPVWTHVGADRNQGRPARRRYCSIRPRSAASSR